MRSQLKQAKATYRKLIRKGHYAKASHLKKWIKTHAELLKA